MIFLKNKDIKEVKIIDESKKGVFISKDNNKKIIMVDDAPLKKGEK